MELVSKVFGQRHKPRAMLVAAVLLFASAIFAYSLSKPSSLLAGLPSTTQTASGRSGDPLNIVIIGDESHLDTVFHAAHWLVPDRTTLTTTAAIIKASVLNKPYPTAPVSNLYVFGRKQDQSFEDPTNSVRQRHHVRLWRSQRQVSGKQLWIGAATFDTGIEISKTNHLPTHHIDANIDAERAFLSDSLQATGLVSTRRLERLAFPALWQTNGGGDRYFDDGNAEVIQLR